MSKKKLVFDESDRKKFIIESKRGKYTKKQKEEYQKKLEIKINRKAKQEKFKLYKQAVNNKFNEVKQRLKEENEYLDEDEDDE